MPDTKKSANIFYTAVALVNCAVYCLKFISKQEKREVYVEVRQEFNRFIARWSAFIATLTMRRNDADRTVLFKEFTDRDYQSYLAVFGYMAEMTDPQRAELEKYAEELINK